jgi:hypothetical protein
MELTAALIGGVIGAVIAGTLGIVGTLIATRSARNISRNERRANAYLDIMLALDDFALRTYQASFEPRTLEAVQRLMANLSTEKANRARSSYHFGSPEVRRLYEASLKSVLYWREATEPAEMQKRWENIRADIAAISAQIEKETS